MLGGLPRPIVLSVTTDNVLTAGSSPELETPTSDGRLLNNDGTLGKEWWTLSPGHKPDLKNWADGTNCCETLNSTLISAFRGLFLNQSVVVCKPLEMPHVTVEGLHFVVRDNGS